MAALLDLRMPGVYTQEVPTLPPTVGVIQSAVPVFIGYTEKAMKKGESLTNKPTRIKSMKEYEDWFGGAKKVDAIEVSVDNRESLTIRPEVRITTVTAPKHKMHYALQLYYANGGGPCYILSVGKDNTDPDGDVLGGDTVFRALQKAKDVTILVFPDGPSLTADKYKNVITNALKHCVKMKNRVTIIDVPDGDKSNVGISDKAIKFQGDLPNEIDSKKYGMSYFPYLETGLVFRYDEAKVTIKTYQSSDSTTPGDGSAATPGGGSATTPGDGSAATPGGGSAAIPGGGSAATPGGGSAATPGGGSAATPGDGSAATPGDGSAATPGDTSAKTGSDLTGKTMKDVKTVNNLVYNKIREAIRDYPVQMSPSPAIAGIYVRTDATQGVWKAPANVSVYGTIRPTIELDDDDHASLNAPDNGKAINAIRAYPGRGILVYGGRTLAGNDLEWRYVNVRRTFCFIEDSVARAMQDFVFAVNNQETWIKVKAMIDSFLIRLWKAGGLYGATPEAAFEVIVGEPDSMSIEEVLSGIMRVIIKVAVARPAEFIILQYEHKFELTEG